MADSAPPTQVNLPRDHTVYIYSKDEARGAWLNDQVRQGKMLAEQARQLYKEWKAYPEKAA